jgi:hypothetical protein
VHSYRLCGASVRIISGLRSGAATHTIDAKAGARHGATCQRLRAHTIGGGGPESPRAQSHMTRESVLLGCRSESQPRLRGHVTELLGGESESYHRQVGRPCGNNGT